MRKQLFALFVACFTLAFPAGASAHARSATFAVDYRLVLDPATRSLPAAISILDGDRALRIASGHATVTVLGDLGEPMLRIGPSGAWANRGSPSAAAAKLVANGRGWQRVGGATFSWHDHRLAPPPYDGSRTGVVAAFRIPIVAGGRTTAIHGTFVRYRRPVLWPWLAAAVLFAASAVAISRARPRLRPGLVLGLGALGGVAAIVVFTALGAADSPSGRAAWGQLALAASLLAAAGLGLVRLHGERRTLLAGLLGTVAAMTSLASAGVFWHGVVISSLPAGITRGLCAVALAAGAAAGASWLLSDEVFT